jgi:hypothetical protein
MGEYADEQFRREVKEKFGFDPGSMYPDKHEGPSPLRLSHCPECHKGFKTKFAVKDHLRDKHGIKPE